MQKNPDFYVDRLGANKKISDHFPGLSKHVFSDVSLTIPKDLFFTLQSNEERFSISLYIKLISIAGPHCGTKLINWTHNLGLSKCFGFTSNMVEELKFRGRWATDYLVEWEKNHEVTNKPERSLRECLWPQHLTGELLPAKLVFLICPTANSN